MSRWIVIFPNNNCLSGIGHSHKETEKEISIGKSASHTNLTTYDVPALAEFFCSVFGFQLIEKRADKLSVLRNAEGFLLTLMYDKHMTPEQGYPGMFHVGFLQPTQHAVDLTEGGSEPVGQRSANRHSAGGRPKNRELHRPWRCLSDPYLHAAAGPRGRLRLGRLAAKGGSADSGGTRPTLC